MDFWGQQTSCDSEFCLAELFIIAKQISIYPRVPIRVGTKKGHHLWCPLLFNMKQLKSKFGIFNYFCVKFLNFNKVVFV